MSAPAEPPAALAPKAVAALRALLFDDPDLSAYAVLDGASIPDLRQRLHDTPEEHACLYRGDLKPDLEATAPHLVKLRRDGPLVDWILGEGWGKSWGVLAITPSGFEALRRHFRGFLRVRDHTGKVLYFRWYDPRILRVYLPTCNAAELRTVYGPVERFLCEAEEPQRGLVFKRHRLRVRGEPFALPKAD